MNSIATADKSKVSKMSYMVKTRTTPLNILEKDIGLDGELKTPDGANSKNALSKGRAKEMSKKSKNESKMPNINDFHDQSEEANIPKHIQNKMALVKQTGVDEI